jgi:cytochrome c oxidase subunit IV
MAKHALSERTYVLVFVGLIVLTATTIAVSRLELGALHAPAALLIAAAKAALVLLFFMHVLYSTRLTWIVAVSGLAWLTILLGLTMADYLTRQSLAVPGH